MTTPAAGFARGGEDLEQATADALARHLDETQRGDLGDLMLRTVSTQALHQTAKHQIAIALQHHVDEVDDDDAADITQTKLANDLLGSLEIVLGDRLLEIATLADELAGVDIDDRHRLRAIDDEGATGRQPDLAVQRLGELLFDSVLGEDILRSGPRFDTIGKIGGNGRHIVANR